MTGLISLIINSFKEIVRQPFYHVILFSGCFLIIISFAFTFFAFGEEVRMIRDMGISTITICGLLTCSLSTSIIITSEFERQTALAVLSKPITRVHFVLGKYLGIIVATTALIFFQGLVFEIALAINKYIEISQFKDHLDQLKDTSLIDYECLLGIYFSLLQILILTAISVILSMYFNITGNLVICFLVFVFCQTYSHIIPYHYQYLGIKSILTAICYIIFPNLYNFSMLTTNNVGFGYQYVVYVSLYSITYSAIIIWLATIFFKRKEIA